MVVPIYPLVPRGTASEVVTSVTAITKAETDLMGAQAVSIAGDSAGGNIALAAAIQLRDERVRLRRTVLIHPAVDLTVENAEIAMVERIDPLLRTVALRPIFEQWRGDLDLQDPRVSPLRGEMSGLGPLTVFSGTHDKTNPDTRLLVSKARGADVEVEYYEGEGLIHASPALPMREGRAARRLIVNALA